MNKFKLFVISLVLHLNTSFAQQKDSLPNPALTIGQRLENLTENNGDVEIEDDYYLQQMERFINNPINLNTATENELSLLQLLTPIHIHSLLSYRTLFGHFIDIYELQAIPGWNIHLIERIRPYVTVASTAVFDSFGDRLKKGHRSIIVRSSGTLEKSKGYTPDSGRTNYYLGSPLKLFVRYKYEFKNGLQYGITAEKDAGEQFFRGTQKLGFDFYSAHFFVRNVGLIKAIAVGDFAVNMGQGLIQWQSGLAAKKGSDVLNIKRQEDVLRPYNSPGESDFHRGIGITVQKKSIQVTAFISYRKIDANFVSDTVNDASYISSIQTSGYHRTKSEVDDKNIQQQITMGGNIGYANKQFHFGINGIHYNFHWPLNKKPELYNRFSLSGNKWSNYSVDYSYTWQNMHFFGEAAVDENYNKALVNGLIISMDAHVDMSIVYRAISRAYQSLYSNAFTESNPPNNENGLFAGIRITPLDIIKIDAYMDLYSFPWLKYRTDAPTRGNDFLVQLTYSPNKQVEIYSRYHVERKPMNDNPDAQTLNPVVIHSTQAWRTEFSYKLSSRVSLRTRVEMKWYDKRADDAENGFLLYTDVSYKPRFRHISGIAGFQYFETDGYNSRFYTFQHDVSYSFSAPVNYGKGYMYYFNFKYNLSRQYSIALRYSQSLYLGKSSIGTGLDEIPGNTKTEVKFQGLINF